MVNALNLELASIGSVFCEPPLGVARSRKSAGSGRAFRLRSPFDLS
ncbi:hypothetical protein RB9434 [Rhodopirellula baltica SH 1]|uniref:Uncharacterized protein n=1 Tax=Rhodopirellula baltica (strain DSM 10527 / NCIMB 13988 / SH1) TaxID=243090 RepID=Q7ULK8_RHOBA|nr:hypothetical protein RB9434 [Rhodopirellula baltica SH 1]